MDLGDRPAARLGPAHRWTRRGASRSPRATGRCSWAGASTRCSARRSAAPRWSTPTSGGAGGLEGQGRWRRPTSWPARARSWCSATGRRRSMRCGRIDLSRRASGCRGSRRSRARPSAIAVEGDTLYVAVFVGACAGVRSARPERRCRSPGPSSGTAAGRGRRRGGGRARRAATSVDRARDRAVGGYRPAARARGCRSTRRSRARDTSQFPFLGPWVNALAKAGDTVYVGGAFGTVGGHPQTHLAAVDAVTGAWRSGFPSVHGGAVNALAVARDDAVRRRGLQPARRART